MNKEQVKEIIKEMFKNEVIEIRIESNGDRYIKTVTTSVEIYIDNEFVTGNTDTAYLE